MSKRFRKDIVGEFIDGLGKMRRGLKQAGSLLKHLA